MTKKQLAGIIPYINKQKLYKKKNFLKRIVNICSFLAEENINKDSKELMMILPPQTIRILHSSSSMKTFVKFISKRRLTSKQKYESKNPKFTTIGKTVDDFSEFTGIPCPKSSITKYQGFRGRLKLTDHLGGGFILVKFCQQSEQEGFSIKKQLEIMTSSIADFSRNNAETWIFS